MARSLENSENNERHANAIRAFPDPYRTIVIPAEAGIQPGPSFRRDLDPVLAALLTRYIAWSAALSNSSLVAATSGASRPPPTRSA